MISKTALTFLLALMIGGPAAAQDSLDEPIPIEVVLRDGPDGVACAPDRARLPARERFELRLINRGRRSIAFRAEGLLDRVDLSTVNASLERIGDGLIIHPGRIESIGIETPPPGRYRFACRYPGRRGSEQRGLLVVVGDGRD